MRRKDVHVMACQLSKQRTLPFIRRSLTQIHLEIDLPGRPPRSHLMRKLDSFRTTSFFRLSIDHYFLILHLDCNKNTTSFSRWTRIYSREEFPSRSLSQPSHDICLFSDNWKKKWKVIRCDVNGSRRMIGRKIFFLSAYSSFDVQRLLKNLFFVSRWLFLPNRRELH